MPASEAHSAAASIGQQSRRPCRTAAKAQDAKRRTLSGMSDGRHRRQSQSHRRPGDRRTGRTCLGLRFASPWTSRRTGRQVTGPHKDFMGRRRGPSAKGLRPSRAARARPVPVSAGFAVLQPGTLAADPCSLRPQPRRQADPRQEPGAAAYQGGLMPARQLLDDAPRAMRTRRKPCH